MIASLARLPGPGLCGAQILDGGQTVAIHPQEEVLVAGAGTRRRRDFALGRHCAHAALQAFGQDTAVISWDDDGAPRWPEGFLGSITHTDGYAAAVVGPSNRFAALGLDAERTAGVTEDLWPLLFTGDERDQLLRAQDRSLCATLLFSAKEACYKAWRPKALTTFRAIEIVLGEERFLGTTVGRRSLQGGHRAKDDLVLTLAWA